MINIAYYLFLSELFGYFGLFICGVVFSFYLHSVIYIAFYQLSSLDPGDPNLNQTINFLFQKEIKHVCVVLTAIYIGILISFYVTKT